MKEQLIELISKIKTSDSKSEEKELKNKILEITKSYANNFAVIYKKHKKAFDFLHECDCTFSNISDFYACYWGGYNFRLELCEDKLYLTYDIQIARDSSDTESLEIPLDDFDNQESKLEEFECLLINEILKKLNQITKENRRRFYEAENLSFEYNSLQSQIGGKKKQQIDRLLELLDKESKDIDGYADRALWHILTRWKSRLPELDGYFHKYFRQCDVTDDGNTDMVIWNLLNHSKLFWRIFEKVQSEKE